MSNILQLPTRAEFIRDRLAEHLDGYGYGVETSASGAQLTAEGGPQCQTVTVEVTARGLLDIDTGQLVRFGSFAWVAEPTDTGVLHGPRTRAQQRGHDVHDAFAACGQRVSGTERTV